MTTQEKIDVLEKAIPMINHTFFWGICRAIGTQLPGAYGDGQYHGHQVYNLLSELNIELPPHDYHMTYCFPLTAEGDEQRRSFLRKHIERLKKELWK